MVNGWKIFIGGKMGTVPAIALELASSVPSDDIPKYLAAVLRTYKEMAEPDERLAKTISRIGFDAFKAEVEARLEVPFDDFIQAAKDAREIRERLRTKPTDAAISTCWATCAF